MGISEVRVQNYKSIVDTGWIELEEDITTLVGGNEAGKTNVLEALSLLGEDTEVPERDLCREADLDSVDKSSIPILAVVPDMDRLPFVLNNINKKNVYSENVENIILCVVQYADAHIEIQQKIAGQLHSYPDAPNIRLSDIKSPGIIIDLIKKLDRQKQFRGFSLASQKLRQDDYFTTFKSYSEYGERELSKKIGKSYRKEDADTEQLVEYALMKFVYFLKQSETESYTPAGDVMACLSDTSLFSSISPISDDTEVLELSDNTDSPYGCLLDQHDLWPSDIDNKDAYNRSVALETASDTLTQGFNSSWNQANLWFKIDRTGERVSLRIWDDPPSEADSFTTPGDRSEGFRWFLSFYLQLIADRGNESNRDSGELILLDDPGTFLHPKGHKDLREAFTNLSDASQIVFSTHSPFMLDPSEVRQIRIVRRDGDEPGTTVTKNLSRVESDGFDTLAPVRAVLGADYADSLFTSTKNLLVEGYTDKIYLERFSSLFEDSDRPSLPENLSIIDMGGAGNAATLLKLLEAEGYDYYVLLDSDRSGSASRSDLTDAGVPDERIGRVSSFLPEDGDAVIEDCFSDERLATVFGEVHEGVSKSQFAERLNGEGHFKRRANATLDELDGRGEIETHPGGIAKGAMADYVDHRMAYDDWTLETLEDRTIEAFAGMIEAINGTVNASE